MIFFPPALLWVAQRVIPFHADHNLLCKRFSSCSAVYLTDRVPQVLHVYPSIFTFAACVQGLIALVSVIRTWSQTVRDKEFLVEMRLQNLEPESKPPEGDAGEGEDVMIVDEEDEE